MTSCEAAHSAITHEAQMMHSYLYGAVEQSGPVFPFASVICVNKEVVHACPDGLAPFPVRRQRRHGHAPVRLPGSPEAGEG
jgi:methionine aminopeptidase